MTEWVGIGVTALVAVTGWVFAGLANGKAKQANKIAHEALTEAVKANEIAENANKLSEDANTLIKRQALQQADPSHIEWVSEWDEEGNSLTLTNTGRDPALNVTVLIKGKKVDRLSDGHSEVSRGEKVTITFPEFVDQRREHNIAMRDRVSRGAAQGIVMVPRYWGDRLTIDVRWLHQSGKPGSQVIDQRVR